MKTLTSSSVNALRELQSASGEELRPFFGRTLTSSLAKHPERASAASGMPSVLDRAFKGEL